MVDAMPRFPTPIAFLLAALIFAPIETRAQDAPPPPQAGSVSTADTPEKAPAVLTLKERLGAKWKDEQRVDNCNIPPEKRGSKPRPDRCAAASPQ
jgi:hypothetical protein